MDGAIRGGDNIKGYGMKELKRLSNRTASAIRGVNGEEDILYDELKGVVNGKIRDSECARERSDWKVIVWRIDNVF